MIGTDFDYDAYEARRVESAKAEGLRFVPETGPKVYSVVCANAADWTEIHNYIINENEIDGIPNRKIECTNLKKTCDRIASYEMSDAEADQLRNHSKVIGVNIDEGYYEGTYKGRDTYPMMDPFSKDERYVSEVKISRDNSASGYYTGTDSSWLSKTAAQIYRHQTFDNPWKNQNDDTLLTDNPEQYGDGTDVDIIVGDSASWLGHIEFVKTGVGEPSNFVGTNVLKSGFAASATTGVCGVLDLILSAPYYIDPDFFEADAGNRLRKRWDGTTVPVESVARSWWQNENTSSRSAKYVSTNISGGSAVIGSKEDFGTISVSNDYTEATHNGDIDTLHTGLDSYGARASHGTPCMSQSFGKTHGWAYNSNKWFISVHWSTGAITSSILYEILKVFHDLKPNRSSDNTKNPTITTNSWGQQSSFSDGNYAYFRTAGDGTGEETISVSGSSVSSPEWLRYFTYGNTRSRWYPPTDSTMVEGAAMLDAGVIWCGSSGNNNNKHVKSDHPDYNNYVSSSSSRTLADAESLGLMVNRVGSPNCIGCVSNYNGTGVDVYRTFNVGALDDNTVNVSGTYMEQKATYSNMGNGIDFYIIGDDSLGAQGGSNYSYSRNDSSYRLDANYNIVSSGGTQSLTSYDQRFGGTSSACPVGTGLLATKLQHNRDWTWSDLKDWLQDEVTNQPSDAHFFQGTEATTSDDSNWNSTRNLQGGERKILWDARSVSKYTISGPLDITGSSLTITT